MGGLKRSLLLALASVLAEPASAAIAHDHATDKCLNSAVQVSRRASPMLYAVRLLADGSVTDVELITPSEDTYLDQEVTDCIRNLHVERGAPGKWNAYVELETTRTSGGFTSGNVVYFHELELLPQLPPGTFIVPRLLPSGGCTYWDYPREALENKVEGTVGVSYRVSELGTVKEVVVSKSSGSKVLDDATAACIVKSRFRPALTEGRPVEYPAQTEITWKIAKEPTMLGTALRQ